jgi:hypothetical protein
MNHRVYKAQIRAETDVIPTNMLWRLCRVVLCESRDECRDLLVDGLERAPSCWMLITNTDDRNRTPQTINRFHCSDGSRSTEERITFRCCRNTSTRSPRRDWAIAFSNCERIMMYYCWSSGLRRLNDSEQGPLWSPLWGFYSKIQPQKLTERPDR